MLKVLSYLKEQTQIRLTKNAILSKLIALESSTRMLVRFTYNFTYLLIKTTVKLGFTSQGYYNNRMPNSSTLFCDRGCSCAVQFGQATPNSDVILLYNIYQLLKLKSPKNDFSQKLCTQVQCSSLKLIDLILNL